MITPVVVVTAKQLSTRLPNKNMLPLGGIPLALWSVYEGLKHNIPTIVSTDILELKELSKKVGCIVVHQPSHNTNNELMTHKQVIEHALQQINITNAATILLQPTSPFRYQDIVLKCWQQYLKTPNSTILTSNQVHNALIVNQTLANKEESVCLWDGCVAVYPPNKICNYDSVVSVRNFHTNSLQIDTEQDYIQACTVLETVKHIEPVLPSSVLNIISPIIYRSLDSTQITMVGRPNGEPIPQDKPVIYINHCEGYQGGRCDGLFIIANKPITQRGINKELRECAFKAKFVIVRHNGEIDWLLANLPEIQTKYYPIRDAISSDDDHLTTGCIAANTLHTLGFKINFIGLYEPKHITNTLNIYHYSAMSREIALFSQANIL